MTNFDKESDPLYKQTTEIIGRILLELNSDFGIILFYNTIKSI